MKNRNLKSRKDKIHFLQQLQQGKATINEVMPVQIKYWMIKDGIYHLQDSDLQLTEQQFLDYDKRQGNKVLNVCGGEVESLVAIIQSEKNV